ncbi:NAD(P)/FAD-dependent oxidoreductase [Rhodoferax sp.]|uniref:NAD(P)/FAD-dependent oxidoreductase n=1 Tax=Rhodoferax sp. TaxID=50421 RepID=UPI002639E38E|nr:NAD(P)/FAD-dependent oxidoreductase [Rhodoferax sp.]MDD4942853.1 NAD(P)/FAD-dependent oxidoreductase [Rhodoferax sp.]MDD5478711.1 NAD(P)/FAD-dependent oxidoreductase [Rhodoferax sp.]
MNTAPIQTDALVIGAGPVGLYTVFQLGLQGVAAQVVDVLPQAGGQCIELYPDKPIFDIPGIPRCSGRELAQRLLAQVAPFKPHFHFNRQVSSLALQADGRWLVSTASGIAPAAHFMARTVFIAAGVGAFVPKELKLEGLATWLGSQLFYRQAPAPATQGQRVLVVGGEDEAVASAVALAQGGAQSVTLVHRRDVLQAPPATLAQFNTLRAAGKIKFLTGQLTGLSASAERLQQVQLTTPEDHTVAVPLDTLVVCQGVSPKLGPMADWGLDMARKQLRVSTETFATSAPGIYAVGDVITYPGKKKLIVCGFHEATLAVFAAAQTLCPDASGVLQYTTSSALLQQRLGVAGTPARC